MQDLSSHNGLLRCFDDETKLLENIKKFLNQRIKCDRDYYAALSPIITAALKIEQPSFSSQIYQVSLLSPDLMLSLSCHIFLCIIG